MKANELRIGNYVYDEEDGNIAEVLPSDFSVTIFTYFKPIPLTEEWLLNLGFSDDEGEFRMDMPNPFNNKSVFESIIFFQDGDGFAQFIIQESGEDLGVTHSSFVPVKIEHVNQLQNLYFALTGEELTIKE